MGHPLVVRVQFPCSLVDRLGIRRLVLLYRVLYELPSLFRPEWLAFCHWFNGWRRRWCSAPRTLACRWCAWWQWWFRGHGFRNLWRNACGCAFSNGCMVANEVFWLHDCRCLFPADLEFHLVASVGPLLDHLPASLRLPSAWPLHEFHGVVDLWKILLPWRFGCHLGGFGLQLNRLVDGLDPVVLQALGYGFPRLATNDAVGILVDLLRCVLPYRLGQFGEEFVYLVGYDLIPRLGWFGCRRFDWLRLNGVFRGCRLSLYLFGFIGFDWGLPLGHDLLGCTVTLFAHRFSQLGLGGVNPLGFHLGLVRLHQSLVVGRQKLVGGFHDAVGLCLVAGGHGIVLLPKLVGYLPPDPLLVRPAHRHAHEEHISEEP